MALSEFELARVKKALEATSGYVARGLGHVTSKVPGPQLDQIVGSETPRTSAAVLLFPRKSLTTLGIVINDPSNRGVLPA